MGIGIGPDHLMIAFFTGQMCGIKLRSVITSRFGKPYTTIGRTTVVVGDYDFEFFITDKQFLRV